MVKGHFLRIYKKDILQLFPQAEQHVHNIIMNTCGRMYYTFREPDLSHL